MILKTVLFSALWSIPLTLFADYIGTISGAWLVPTTIFPFRLFGVMPIEDFIWSFLVAYSIIIFYEHFLDKGADKLVGKRTKYLLWFWIILIIIFFAILIIRPEFLTIKYAYFYLGLVFILLPAITFLSSFPRMLSKYVKTGSYFFLLMILYELTGLHLNQWQFPNRGFFVGWVDLLGYRFPFEELFFFCILWAVSVLSYYEFFDDDSK